MTDEPKTFTEAFLRLVWHRRWAPALVVSVVSLAAILAILAGLSPYLPRRPNAAGIGPETPDTGGIDGQSPDATAGKLFEQLTDLPEPSVRKGEAEDVLGVPQQSTDPAAERIFEEPLGPLQTTLFD